MLQTSISMFELKESTCMCCLCLTNTYHINFYIQNNPFNSINFNMYLCDCNLSIIQFESKNFI